MKKKTKKKRKKQILNEREYDALITRVLSEKIPRQPDFSQYFRYESSLKK